MLPYFYCWTICEWVWVLQSVPRHPWDWLYIEFLHVESWFWLVLCESHASFILSQSTNASSVCVSFVLFIHQGLWNMRCQQVLQLVFVVDHADPRPVHQPPFSRHSENRFLVAREGHSQDGAQDFFAQSLKLWGLQESCSEIHSSLNMLGAITTVREVVQP